MANKALEELIRKTATATGYSNDRVRDTVYGYFRTMAESMNRLEYDKYLVPRFCSFKLLKYKYDHMFTTFEAYSYLRRLNVHKRFDKWEIPNRPEFAAYMTSMIEKYGSVEELTKAFRLKAKKNAEDTNN
jgi:hypothetical protein